MRFEINQVRGNQIIFVEEGSNATENNQLLASFSFKGKLLETAVCTEGMQIKVYIGVGKTEALHPIVIKELGAKAVKEMKRLGQKVFSIDTKVLLGALGEASITHLVEGCVLGDYAPKRYTATTTMQEPYLISLVGISEDAVCGVEKRIAESHGLSESVAQAREWVNAPGNKLRPYQFVAEIEAMFRDTNVAVEVIDEIGLREMGMDALIAVGESSAYEPYLVVLKYLANPHAKEVVGLVGKGVTCDTGGYCLKPASSMLGIKGDMAGAAAVVGAVDALQKNQKQVNVVACIPICENRISTGSLLPGDVISSYAGKTIEIINTDAEGRLILADAVSYLVEKEQVTKVLDIATLTGAVVGLLGFSIGGVLSNNDQLWQQFEQASVQAGERYLRIPYYKEHEKMIESKVADIKNMGESYCGTITAALFIQAFTKEVPWIHLDIAGTAWVDSPVFEYQSKGATGAGVTSIYYLCQQ